MKPATREFVKEYERHRNPPKQLTVGDVAKRLPDIRKTIKEKQGKNAPE